MKHILLVMAYMYLAVIAIETATIAFFTSNYLIAAGVGFIGNLIIESYVVYRINHFQETSSVESEDIQS